MHLILENPIVTATIGKADNRSRKGIFVCKVRTQIVILTFYSAIMGLKWKLERKLKTLKKMIEEKNE